VSGYILIVLVDLQKGHFSSVVGREFDVVVKPSSFNKTCQLIRSIKVEEVVIMVNARFDQQGDTNGQTLHRLVKLYDAPEFVKAASSDAINYVAEDKNPAAFADTSSLSFPCHTAPATYVSMMYFLENQGGLGKKANHIKDRIVKAADFFGIKRHISGLIEKHAQANSNDLSKLSDDQFAYVYSYDNGAKDRHLPLRNSNEVKEACAYLKTYRDEFVYSDRVKIAQKILKSGKLDKIEGEDLTYLYKQAGAAVGSAKNAASLLFKRAVALRRLGKDLDVQQVLAKSAEACLNNSAFAHTMGGMQKIAKLIDSVDREYKLQKITALGKPEDLFSFTVKEASDFADESVQLTTGSIYKKSDLLAIPADNIRDLLGSDFVDRVSAGGIMLDTEKLAEELRTLPRGDAKLFERLADVANVKPFGKEASVKKNRLLELAAKHAQSLA